MKYFEYTFKDSHGKKKAKTITADTREQALSALKSRGVHVDQLYEMPDFLGLRHMALSMSTKIKKVDVAEFFEQMAFMLETGITSYNALKVLRDYSANKKLAHIANNLANIIRQGASLSDAMLKNKDMFEEFMIQQIRSGEKSGDMATAMVNLAAQIRREVAFGKKVKGAMIYPIFILVVMVGVVAALLMFVIPQIADTLTNLGGELPQITVILIQVSEFCQHYWWAVLLVIVAIAVVWIVLNKIPPIKYEIDRISLKIPIVGALLIRIDIARFCRSMSSMLSCGVTLIEALGIAKATISNKHVRHALDICEENIRMNGWSLSFAMQEHEVFPEIMIQLVEIGSTSSKIPEVMEKLAVQYEEESESMLNTLTSMMQPLLMLIVGAVVGVVVIAMFLPMMSVVDQL